MKIHDLLTESQQLDELKVGDIGKNVGKVSRGIGAVAGGVRGAYDAAKQGFQAGRDVVSGRKPPTTAQDINAQGPKGTAAAKSQSGAAGIALAKSAQAVADAGSDPKQTDALYAQVKASINQLDDAGKKKILQLVQKSLTAQPAQQDDAPQQSMADKISAAQSQAKGDAADPAQTRQQKQADAAKTAQDQMAANTAADNTKQAAPAAGGQKLSPQQIAAKKAELQGRRSAGKSQGTTGSGFGDYVKKASGQRIVGANPDGSPKIQQIKASKINIGNNLSEALARRIEIYKNK